MRDELCLFEMKEDDIFELFCSKFCGFAVR